MQPDQQQRIMGYFIEEAKEHLSTIERGLLTLQATIDDPEGIQELFRAAHSVKGGAAMLGLDSIQKISHRLEDYFKVLQEHPIQADQTLESLFLKGFDALNDLLEELQSPLGLTEDNTRRIMAAVEPVLQSLGQHLDQLVAEGTTGLHRTPPPAPSRPPMTAPAVVELPANPPEDSALQLIFRSDVPTRLREMLQLFKQPEHSALARQQLREICRSLEQAGEQFSLRAWCDLMRAVAQAIANPNNSHRALASIIIREVKQAQELVLAGRADAITISPALQDLLPAETSPVAPSDDDLENWLASAETDPSVLTSLGLEALPEVEAAPVTEAAAPRALEASLGSAESAETGAKVGPEVGMAELNSLADLFEGEVPDLDLTWEEEVLGAEEASATGAAQAVDLPDDLMDLLEQVTDATTEPRTLATEDLDFLDLLGEGGTDAPSSTDAPTTSSTASSETDSFEDLLSIYSSPGEAANPAVASPLADADADLDDLEDLLAALDADRGSAASAAGDTDPALQGLEAIFEDFSVAEPDLLEGLEAATGGTEQPPATEAVPPVAAAVEDRDLGRGETPTPAVPGSSPPGGSGQAVEGDEAALDALLQEMTLTEAGGLGSGAAALEAELGDFLDAIASEPAPADINAPVASLTNVAEDLGDLAALETGGEDLTQGWADTVGSEWPEADTIIAEALEMDGLAQAPAPSADGDTANLEDKPGPGLRDVASAVGTFVPPPPSRQLVTDPWEVMFGEEDSLLTETETARSHPAATASSDQEERQPPTTDTLSDPTEDTLTDSNEADKAAVEEPTPPTTSEIPAAWLEEIDDFFGVDAAIAAPEPEPPQEDWLAEIAPDAPSSSPAATVGEGEGEPGAIAAETTPMDELAQLWPSAVPSELEASLAAQDKGDSGLSEADARAMAELLAVGGDVVPDEQVYLSDRDNLEDRDDLLEANDRSELEDLGNLDNLDSLEPLADLETWETASASVSVQDAALAAQGLAGGSSPDETMAAAEDFPEHLFDDFANDEELELAEIAIEPSDEVGGEEDIAATLGLEQLDLLVETTGEAAASEVDFPDLDQELESLALDALDLAATAGDSGQATIVPAEGRALTSEDGSGVDAELDSLEDLEALLAGDPAVVDTEPIVGLEDLDALLDGGAVPAPQPSAAITAPTTEATDFSELESLLGDETNASPTPAPVTPTPVAEAPKAEEDEFDDLEKLLKAADETLGGPAVAANRVQTPSARRRAMVEQTMRVPVKQLDGLSNLVGELVVSRNSLEQNQERLRQFLDNLLYQVQQLSDVGQRMRDLYERSLLEASLLSHRQSYQAPTTGGHGSGNGSGEAHSTGVSFDALEMDRFTAFHTLSQEMIELIVRVRESASDIEFTGDETDQITRQFRQITTQLQESLTRSRMVPFAQAADRLPRAVRDISLKCGKQADLQVEGRDTLIDKMILEQLYDPLTHLVNNAITHGIETPEERIAAGKPPKGRISIRAFHTGNQTVIAIADDGAGIDAERVKRKAVEKGLITPQEAQTMSRLDAYDLLFLPGFSTKDKADDFAGRGVGMDVVRTSLSEIRGAITTDSTLGKGTTFTIRLPLTLSISKALLCLSNRTRIAFPMDGVEDMLDVPRDRVQTNEEGQTCILWRDSLLPFRPLSDLLKYNRQMGRGSIYGGGTLDDDIISVVVLRSASNFVALQVDQVEGEREIVIKQLEGPVPKPIGIAGATVMGDGRIMPIADVLELIDLAMGRMRGGSSSMWEQQQPPPVEIEATTTEPTVLIVDDSITVRELLSMTFTKSGYRVEQARDGQEAWEKLRSGLPCDLVFCDIEMPRMDGLELLSRLQKDPHLNQIPIAMLTSRGADRHRQMAIQLGASGYFTKPYLEEALLDAASRMLKGEVLVASGA